jgi:hypothetical protein
MWPAKTLVLLREDRSWWIMDQGFFA